MTSEEERNRTFATDYILMGLSDNPHLQIVLFVVFSVLYLATLTANGLLITVCIRDSHLQSPMYLFLINLSFLDTLYSSSIVPNVVVHILQGQWHMSFLRCGVQMFSYLFVAGTESVLMAIMAYDRYVAICFPLHYNNIMRPSVCRYLLAFCWLSVLPPALLCACFSIQLPLYGCNVIDHFFCETVTLLNVGCRDNFVGKMIIFGAATLVVLLPSLVILISYVHIIVAIIRIPSSDGRRKAFSTCGSHLIVVIAVYGTAIFQYLIPVENSTAKKKLLCFFYAVGPPLWNPIIYSLRNNAVTLALKNLFMHQFSLKPNIKPNKNILVGQQSKNSSSL